MEDLYTINEFLNSFMYIYPKEVELKTEHHPTFFDLDTTIEIDELIYKFYNELVEFPFLIVRIPHLPNNISSSIFYGSVRSELLRIGRCTLLFSYFKTHAPELYYYICWKRC